MQCAPFEIGAFSTYPTRSSWDAAAVEIVGTMLERWHLTPGTALVGGEAASVVTVTTRDGEPAILKVGYPHPEAIWEAVALEAYGPGNAPRVLRQDPWTWSLLLERIDPGTDLAQSELGVMEKLGAGVTLLRRISSISPPDGIPDLREIVGAYLTSASRRLSVQRAELENLGVLRAVEAGLSDAYDLIATDRRSALLHGDLNPHNVLRGSNGWRVIDPKPVRGDLEYDVWPLVSQLPASVALGDRLEATGVDVRRAARWGVVRAALSVTWAIEDRVSTHPAVRELREWTTLLSVL